MEHTEDCVALTEAYNDPCSCDAGKRRALDPSPIAVHLVIPDYRALDLIRERLEALVAETGEESFLTLDVTVAEEALRL